MRKLGQDDPQRIRPGQNAITMLGSARDVTSGTETVRAVAAGERIVERMTESQSQEPALALLADAATHGGAAVKRIDTHAASVFLAGDRAYKVKRAVRLPLDRKSTRLNSSHSQISYAV